MSPPSPFLSPATYHLLSYGTLLGSTLFQSFVSGVIAFRVLPRPQFSTLQRHTFPVYFTLQTLAPLALLVTYPSGGPASLLGSVFSSSAHVPTATDVRACWLIGTMFFTGLTNLAYLGPKTTRIMGQRKHQETRDGKKSYEGGPHSPEMQRLNRLFGRLHGLSTMVNLAGLCAMIWYAGLLGQGLAR